MNSILRRAVATTAVIALTSVGGAAAASASQGRDDAGSSRSTVAKSPRVIATGTCGNAATKLKVSAEDSGAQVEFELDQNSTGKTWRLVLTRDGKVLDRASRTTSGRSGSLHWRVTPGGASNGTYAVISKRGGTSCRLAVTL